VGKGCPIRIPIESNPQRTRKRKGFTPGEKPNSPEKVFALAKLEEY